MEGIDDGRASDRCFVCGLLEPVADDEDCARCGRRMRWRPATMTGPALERRLARLVAAWREAREAGESGACDALAALCEAVHDAGPAGVAALAAIGGPDVPTLRRAWAALRDTA